MATAAPTALFRGSHPPRQRLHPGLLIAAPESSSQLIKALSNAFIEHKSGSYNGNGSGDADRETEPFSIAWYKGNSSEGLGQLAARSVDLAVSSLGERAVEVVVGSGVAERGVVGWRGSWVLVGPISNPASLLSTPSTPIHNQLTHLLIAATTIPPSHSSAHTRPIRFLSRNDSSATNVKEASLWTSLGQAPWATPQSSWYHVFPDSGAGALRAAAALGEYTLVQREVWAGVEWRVREGMEVFAESSGAEDDALSSPVHVLVGKNAQNKELAEEFLSWLVSPKGGKKIVQESEIGGERIYGKTEVGRGR